VGSSRLSNCHRPFSLPLRSALDDTSHRFAALRGTQATLQALDRKPRLQASTASSQAECGVRRPIKAQEGSDGESFPGDEKDTSDSAVPNYSRSDLLDLWRPESGSQLPVRTCPWSSLRRQPPPQPNHPRSCGPLAKHTTKQQTMKPTSPTLAESRTRVGRPKNQARESYLLPAPPLYVQPPSAKSLLPTAVPVSWPTKALTMYAVFTRFLALSSMR
jgi:hypothetical protein